MLQLGKTLIEIGFKVIDSEDNIGIITNIHDRHNVEVEFINKEGSGIYCMEPRCPFYDPLKKL